MRRRFAHVALLLLTLALPACRRLPFPPLSVLGAPPRDFAHTPPPPAPDYADERAWLVLPDRMGYERELPGGDWVPLRRDSTPAVDVFFVPPTTQLPNDRWNSPWDREGTFDALVLRSQVNVFVSCCRVWAPRYRQATLGAQVAGERRAIELAYGDVERAFDRWLTLRDASRPFILASHSQGTLHALRLLETRIARTPLQSKLVAAYLVGHFVPPDVGEAGVPVCETPTQSGCIVSWNTAAPRSRGILGYVDRSYAWHMGRYRKIWEREALCVNPLVWRVGAGAPKDSSRGALPPAEEGRPLETLIAGAVEARCDRGMLVVSAGGGFPQELMLTDVGRHLLDYNLFWEEVRGNATARLSARQSR